MSLTDEARFIKACLPLDRPAGFKDALRQLIKPSLDWQEISAIASWQGVAPLIYNNLKILDAASLVPGEFLGNVKDIYHASLIRNMYLHALLERVLRTFVKRDVACIVLKGMALANEIYRDIALRPMGDIDLLIRYDDLAVAESCLTELGFTLNTEKPRNWSLQHHYHITYLDPQQNVPIELHWHITHKRSPSRVQITDDILIDAWWDRASPSTIANRPALILSPGDQVFHLCQHFLKSRFSVGFVSKAGLIQLCDIANTVAHYRDQIDWQQTRDDAEEYRMVSLVGAILELAAEIVHNNSHALPVESRGISVHDNHDLEMCRLMGSNLFERAYIDMSFSNNAFKTLEGNSIRERLSGLLSALFPDKAVLAEKYSVPVDSRKIYLYCLIHPFHQILRHRRFVSSISRLKKEKALRKWIGNSNFR